MKPKVTDNERRTSGDRGPLKTVVALQALLMNKRGWNRPPRQCNTTTERNREAARLRNHKVRRKGSRVPAK